MTSRNWECVVGLEVHIQLATASKLFSGASTEFGASPNSQACLIDVALPGVLPVCNREAVRMAVLFGLAVGATINRRSIFARKNYFYPDLPKGYQISQYELPIVLGGSIDTTVDATVCPINLTRAHLEEDAGKSLHDQFSGVTGIDLNRAGTPLLEIVSEPEIRSGAQAANYLRVLHNLVTTLGICDGNLQDGSMRCDANVSIRRRGDTELGTRTELKNINSFRFVERGIESEMLRQIDVLESGGAVTQETRQYDAQSNTSRPMRGKEHAHDYRYFPDPDLPPLVLSEEYIDSIRARMPELPQDKLHRFISQYRISSDVASQLTSSVDAAQYFEAAVVESPHNPKAVANWIIGELTSYLNRENLEIKDSAVPADALGRIVARIEDGTISGNGAKTLLKFLWAQPDADIDRLIAKEGLEQNSDDEQISQVVAEVLDSHPDQVRQYQDGTTKVLGYLVGQAMKASRGKLDAKRVNEEIRRQLAPTDYEN